MPNGVSLNIGLDRLDPAAYGEWEGTLHAAEADARAMHRIAKERGFDARLMLTQDATRDQVIDALRTYADTLTAGDTFFLSYAGHGGQVPDVSGDESDGLDETWCLYDGQLLDDELTVCLSRFQKDVRILVICDSCHSGTNTRSNGAEMMDAVSPDGFGFRTMSAPHAFQTYRTNRQFYDEIKRDLPNPLPQPQAAIKTISACRDDQLAADGRDNGFFTSMLLKTWDEGSFDGDFERFFKKIEKKMYWKTLWNGKKQEPVYRCTNLPHTGFQSPFSI